MTASRRDKRHWEDKLRALVKARQKADEALLVGIHQAREAGLSQALVAHSVEGVSPSGVRAKAEKGRAILERRRRGANQS